MNTENSLPYLTLTIENNILIGMYTNDLHIDIKMAREIVQNRLLFTKGKKVPCMIFSKGVVSMDKPAREYLASGEGTAGLSASAILVKSSFSSFLGNFFIRVNKTTIPVRLFSDAEKAKAWLRNYIQ